MGISLMGKTLDASTWPLPNLAFLSGLSCPPAPGWRYQSWNSQRTSRVLQFQSILPTGTGYSFGSRLVTGGRRFLMNLIVDTGIAKRIVKILEPLANHVIAVFFDV